MSNYIHFTTLYSRWQNVDALLVIEVFKNKIYSYSLMDTAGLRLPTKQIRDLSTFNVRIVWRLSKLTASLLYALSKLKTYPLLMSVMSQDWAFQQGASLLQTFADLWTFSINISPPGYIFLCWTLQSYFIIALLLYKLKKEPIWSVVSYYEIVLERTLLSSQNRWWTIWPSPNTSRSSTRQHSGPLSVPNVYCWSLTNGEYTNGNIRTWQQ
jgi:hypothetical protein